MSRDLFGTDGVRGLAGQYPLDYDGTRRIGMALGSHFAQAGEQILIGWDPRESSAELVKAISDGLIAVGVQVVSVGIIPTPGVAYLTREHDEFVAGIMITASHNAYQYNGIKAFDSQGGKLSDETEVEVNRLIDEGVAERSGGGSRTDETLAKAYEDFLVSSAPDLKLSGLSIAVDAANGAASGLARRVFERLGAKVSSLADQPDGKNINDHCGATDPAELTRVVREQSLDLGIAVDGDADRLAMIDDQGRELNGDHLLYILAVGRQLPTVVATVMTNMGVEQALNKKGIVTERVRVGDRYILERLLETGLQLGVEQSGHIIQADLLATGDALLGVVQVLATVQASAKPLAAWRDEVVLLPQSTVNVSLADRTRMELPAVQAYIAEQTERLSGKGRVLIRPSGTEPLVRVMVEAPKAETLAQEMAEHIKELVG